MNIPKEFKYNYLMDPKRFEVSRYNKGGRIKLQYSGVVRPQPLQPNIYNLPKTKTITSIEQLELEQQRDKQRRLEQLELDYLQRQKNNEREKNQYDGSNFLTDMLDDVSSTTEVTDDDSYTSAGLKHATNFVTGLDNLGEVSYYIKDINKNGIGLRNGIGLAYNSIAALPIFKPLKAAGRVIKPAVNQTRKQATKEFGKALGTDIAINQTADLYNYIEQGKYNNNQPLEIYPDIQKGGMELPNVYHRPNQQPEIIYTQNLDEIEVYDKGESSKRKPVVITNPSEYYRQPKEHYVRPDYSVNRGNKGNKGNKGKVKRYDMGGNVARTPSDYQYGILKGIDTFKFNKPNYQQMTMNTPAGTVPYPIEYRGYTKGRLSDIGIAKPYQNFTVYGDTVKERKLT